VSPSNKPTKNYLHERGTKEREKRETRLRKQEHDRQTEKQRDREIDR